MHVHTIAHGASSVRGLEAKDAKTAGATNASGPASPTSLASASATANTAVGATASSNPFASLAVNLQAMLLGVSQTAPSTTTQALSAYGQVAL